MAPSATHTLVHLHPNNSCGSHMADGTLLPDVFECTYVRSDLVRSARPNQRPLPTPLDEPNDATLPVRVYSRPPFVASAPCTDDCPCGRCALCLETEDGPSADGPSGDCEPGE